MSTSTLITAENARDIIQKYDTFLFDCDGVIWQGTKLIPNIKETLQLLRKLNKRIVFVSNNSTKSRSEYLNKFVSLGIDADVVCFVDGWFLWKNEIFGSAYASAVYVKKVLKLPTDKKVFIVGMKGIQDELDAQGIPWIGGEENIPDLSKLDTIKPIPVVGAVLFGMDVHISYTKYAQAFSILYNDPDCHFLATNDDLTFPAGGTLYPGTGALLSALSSSLKRQPKVLGKPHQSMMDAVIADSNLDVSRACMVGDRLDTDIAFGKKGNLATILVGTGVTSEAERLQSKIIPDYYIPSFGDIFNHIK